MKLKLYGMTIDELEAHRNKWRARLSGNMRPREDSKRYRKICRKIQSCTNTINNKTLALEKSSRISI